MTKRRNPDTGSGDPINEQIKRVRKPIFSSLKVRTLDGTGTNGNKETIITSRPHGHFGVKGPSVRDLMNILCPKLVLKYKSIGNFFTTTNALSNGEVRSQDSVSVGRTIPWKFNQQAFFCFQHLSVCNRRLFDTSKYSVNSLLNLAVATNNIKTEIEQPILAETGALDPTISFLSKYRSLFYQGGYTEHIFYNPNNTEVVLELWEVRPRRALGVTDTPLTALFMDTNIRGLEFTGKASVVAGSGAAAYMQPTNPDFTVTNNCHLFHDKFTCTNNRKIKVLGGETVKVFVKHPAFRLNGSDILHSIGYPDYFNQLITDSFINDIDYVPFATCWLMGRVHGQVVTDDGPSTAEAITKVAYSHGQLAHMQRECHTIRQGLYVNNSQTREINEWDTVAEETAMYLDNPLTDTVVNVSY